MRPFMLKKKEVHHAQAAQNHRPHDGGSPAYGAYLFCAYHGGMAGVEAPRRVCPPAVEPVPPGRDVVDHDAAKQRGNKEQQTILSARSTCSIAH